MENTLKINPKEESTCLTEKEKLDLFQVEELEDRFELGTWFDDIIVNGACEVK